MAEEREPQPFEATFPTALRFRDTEAKASLKVGFGAWAGIEADVSERPLGVEERTLPRERVRCVPGMLNSSEVKVLYPT